jgi:hypothetical protein
MKIALAYPKIPDTTGFLPKQCMAFEKYDGTNIHWVLKTNNSVQFGTRRDRFDANKEGWLAFNKAHPGLEDLEHAWSKVSSDIKREVWNVFSWKEAIVFTEYFGPSSFAGEHKPNEKHELKVIDLQVEGVMIDPKFIRERFYYLPQAKLLYEGKYSGQLVEDIRRGKYTKGEGAVLKGMHTVGNFATLHMAKVKTDQYMRSLQFKFKENWKDHWE